MIVIAHITQAQAATIINAVFTIIQYTFSLAVIILLVYFMYNIHSAIAWSGVTRMLHSSPWPALLRADSTSSGGTQSRISAISYLSVLGGVLVAIAGVITPLGLSDSPPLQTAYVSMGASYVQDGSPIGLATSPRDRFAYGRICGALAPVPCPGNGLNTNTTQISPDTFKAFTSTQYGPFNMQFRRYYGGIGGYNYPMSTAQQGTIESLILRNDMFAIEGLIVDVTTKPGIGLWNHTLPTLQRGGVWSEDVLWLEPVSACVNTNLTIDYQQKNNNYIDEVKRYNLTDRGGFVQFTPNYRPFSRDGQNIDLHQHAYKGAVLSNFYRMRSFNNMTRNESYVGRAFPSNSSSLYWPSAGKMKALSLNAFLNPNATTQLDPDLFNATDDLDISCQGYGGGDIANMTNVHVHCSLVLGSPHRADGGDPRLPGDNTTWTQSLHVCASALRARMQQVTFSFNGTSSVDSLRISRQDTNTSVLWAIEKTDLMIADVNIFWGRVADSYENDPSLSTIRSEVFYLPGTIWDIPSAGNPSTVPATLLARGLSNSNLLIGNTADYSGAANYALHVKWQSLIQADPENNPTQILNMVWIDMATNSLVGTNTATTLTVAPYVPSIAYDSRYGIPAILLVCIWLPSFLIAASVLLSGRLKFSYIRHLLNQTSMGRVLVGDSAMRVSILDSHGTPVGSHQLQPSTRRETGRTATSHLNTKDWSKTVGQTPVIFGPVDSIVESPSRDSPKLGTGRAREQPIMPTTRNGDHLRRRRTLGTALKEHLQSGHSLSTPYSESPDTEKLI